MLSSRVCAAIEADPGERRASSRIRTVFRSTRITSSSDAGLARMLNISNGGALIETPLKLAVGDRLQVELDDDVALSAAVLWRREHLMGVQFTASIDCIAMLIALSKQCGAALARPLRLPVSKPVEVTDGFKTHMLLVHDISKKGLRIRDEGKLKPGMEIAVRLSPTNVVRGAVRWARGLEVGVELNELISDSVLSSAASLARS